MTKPKFTHGPWNAQIIGNGERGVGAIVLAQGELNKSFVICQCLGPDSESNAYLLASAPEMYTELVRLYSWFSKLAEESPLTWGKDVNEIGNILSKI